jgi:hypothetical protein
VGAAKYTDHGRPEVIHIIEFPDPEPGLSGVKAEFPSW